MNQYIDMEFTRSNEAMQRLYCCVIRDETGHARRWWLLDDSQAQQELATVLRTHHENGDVFVAYASAAEARSFIALGLDPIHFRWIDLHAEFRQLVNHTDRWRYGMQWCKTDAGEYKIKKTRPPRYRNYSSDVITDENGYVVDNSLPVCNLLNAGFKFLGIDRRPESKSAMRELILEDRQIYKPEEQAQILNYCAEDVEHLHELHYKMTNELTRLLPPRHRDCVDKYQQARGRWSADIAKMQSVGIPVDLHAVQSLSANHEEIITDAMDRLAGIYPFYKKINGRWKQSIEAFTTFVRDKGLLFHWPRTDKKKLRNDKDTLKEFRHIPEIEALRQTRKLIKQVESYRPGAMPEFLKNVGSDSHLRIHFNQFGTQTGRNAPPASVFVPAQSKWLRCLIRPPAGKVIVGADYSSQEYLVAAILTGDRRMIQSYQSGDVYVAFGKLAGLIPQDASGETHPNERNLCKSLLLGIQFGMGGDNLAKKLSGDTGKRVTTAYANTLLAKHQLIYRHYWHHVAKTEADYKGRRPLVLPNGWALFEDNPNPLSVRNFPVQGTAAVILQRAVRLMHDEGLAVCWTMHDAVYCLGDEDDVENIRQRMTARMIQATVDTLGTEGNAMRIDTHTYTRNVAWIEKGCQEMYDRLKHYLTPLERIAA